MITEGTLKIWFLPEQHPTQSEIGKTDAEMEADGYEYDSHAWTYCDLDSGCGVHHHYVRVYRQKQPTLQEELEEAVKHFDDYANMHGIWSESFSSARAILRRIIVREEEKHDRSKR